MSTGASINETLSFTRRVLDLSQEELSDILNITRSTVAKNESRNSEDATSDYISRFISMLNFIINIKEGALNIIQQTAVKDTLEKLLSYQESKINLDKINEFF